MTNDEKAIIRGNLRALETSLRIAKDGRQRSILLETAVKVTIELIGATVDYKFGDDEILTDEG